MKKLERSPVRGDITPTVIAALRTEMGSSLLKKIHEEYLYWDKVKYLPMPDGVSPAEIWNIVKRRRENSSYELSFFFWWNFNKRGEPMVNGEPASGRQFIGNFHWQERMCC